MTPIFLGLGSNTNRHHNIASGLVALESLLGELVVSPVYESKSVGFEGSHFFNLVVAAHTTLTIAELSSALKKIENQHGRIRNGSKYSPRSLDIDILTYGDFVGVDSCVELPRDEITFNAFVLQPLSDIAPTALHPQLKISYADLWNAYDKNSQQLWRIDFTSTSYTQPNQS